MTHLTRLTYTVLLLLASLVAEGQIQIQIKGRVLDRRGRPIHLANVYLSDTFEGTATDSLGHFALSTEQGFPISLVASHVSYEADTIVLKRMEDATDITLHLREKLSLTLEEVVVSASTLRFNDRKGQAVMKPMDIYTNPAGSGDLALSMRQMPGLQQVGQTEGFFVRGGAAWETNVSIEGIRVQRFFGKNGHNTPTRARFETGMFQGLSLATGGYGASKQGGLSGLLELQLSEQSPSSLTLSLASVFAGIGCGYLSPKKTTYIEQGISVIEGSALRLMLRNEYKLPEAPFGVIYHARLAWAPTKQDDVKALVMMRRDKHTSLAPAPTPYGTTSELYKGRNDYAFGMGRWHHHFQDGYTKATLAVGLGWDDNKLHVDYPDLTSHSSRITSQELDAQIRLRLDTRLASLKMSSGLDYAYSRAEITIPSIKGIRPLRDATSSAWVEAFFPISRSLSLESGLRLEHSSLIGSATLLPRAALALRLHPTGTLSLDLGRYAALGDYYLTHGIQPTTREVAYQANLTYEWRPKLHHLLRVQVYNKEYRSLTRLYYDHQVDNLGRGYARGVDVFWRVTRLIPNVEHWLSYTYTDARRSWLRAHELECPDFVATHTASAVIKYWCKPISSLFNLALNYRTGMPYHNPNRNDRGYYNELNDETLGLSFSYNYPFMLGRMAGVVVVSVENILNAAPTFGYRYSPEPNAQGNYSATRITTSYRQVYMLGFFVNIGVDRRKEIMNTNL
ncbi:MAG: TonB-dependent receptor [Porphyromonadaceae bacterium]|nr:TonB-dependent receptor [Porphyromonadaceae bacterium]